MRWKKTFDARTLFHQALEHVQRVETGESPEFVGAGLGLTQRTIYRWLAAYHTGGVDAVKAKSIPGAPTKLTGAHRAHEDAPAIEVRICPVDVRDHSGGDPACVCRRSRWAA